VVFAQALGRARTSGGTIRRAPAAAGRVLVQSLAAERERWPLWIPVGLGVGIAVYFSVKAEPPVWFGPVALLLCVLAGTLGRRSQAILLLAAGVGAAAAGLTVAQLRTQLVAAPVLEREIGPVMVTGLAQDVEPLPRGLRLVLDQPTIEGLAPEATPEKVRIRVNAINPAPVPGDWISVRATLVPPSPPVAPGAYDFQRHMFFERIGGLGFAYGAATVEPAPDGSVGQGWRVWVNDLRLSIAVRIRAVLPGDAGAIAAALVTGSQAGISEDTVVAMRDSGLAHLLSISGLHVGLVAGILFVGLRTLLAFVPPVALRYPVKKWAAVLALLGTLFYLFLAGATVPTQRAFLMTAVVMVAVLLDRSPLSMRLVAWAAFFVLLFSPETLVGPSFQMSFAAVVALIAAYEAARPLRVRLRREASLPLRAVLFVGSLALTSLVATIATAPYAIYHFNRVADYGILANLLAVPLTGLWIMPCAIVGLLLMPFGLEAGGLVPMGWGVDVLIAIAGTIAGWPGAVAAVAAMPPVALALITFGGLWLCLWQRRWRLLGLAPAAIGFVLLAFVRPPDILVSGDAKLMAVAGEDGQLVLSSARAEQFTAEQWMRRAGQLDAQAWPQSGTAAGGRLRCDPLGCIYRAEGRVIALARSLGALAEDCQVAELVISTEPVRVACPSAARVVDRFDLWRNGGYAVWLDDDGLRVESVEAWRGERPWTGPRR
jgi:competence protein ComEC